MLFFWLIRFVHCSYCLKIISVTLKFPVRINKAVSICSSIYDAIHTASFFWTHTGSWREWEGSKSRNVCSTLFCSVCGAQYAEMRCSSSQWLLPPTLHTSGPFLSSAHPLYSLSINLPPPCLPHSPSPPSLSKRFLSADREPSYHQQRRRMWGKQVRSPQVLLCGCLSLSGLHRQQL